MKQNYKTHGFFTRTFIALTALALLAFASVSAVEKSEADPKNKQPEAGAGVEVDPVIKAGEKVIIKGKLNGGLMAIGGETTGWVLAYKNSKGAAELEVNMGAIKKAESFDGAEVTVTGTIVMKSYIERGSVLILQADTVAGAKKASTSTAR